MYHHSSSPYYSCQGSNGFVSQPSASSYGDLLQAEQHYYYSQQQQQQQQQPLFRRVVSTGDLGTPVPAVAARYSTEERRERIEKYRSKRNQRNFQKKITVRLPQDLPVFSMVR
jgi:ribonuclease P/MRP protein subunit RPP1